MRKHLTWGWMSAAQRQAALMQGYNRPTVPARTRPFRVLYRNALRAWERRPEALSWNRAVQLAMEHVGTAAIVRKGNRTVFRNPIAQEEWQGDVYAQDVR